MLHSVYTPWETPLTYIPHKFVTILLNNKYDGENNEEDPIIITYKLNKDEGTANIFGSLTSKDLNPDYLYTRFKVIDLRITKNMTNNKHKLHILSMASSEADKKESIIFDLLNVYTFKLDNFKLKYHMENMNYKDMVTLSFRGPAGAKEITEISLVIYKNAQIFMYIMINAILFVAFLILCSVTFCIYRKRKRKRLMELNNSDIYGEDSKNTTNFEI